MTGAQDATEGKWNWMRPTARVLGLFWALYWTWSMPLWYMFVLFGCDRCHHSGPVSPLLEFCLPMALISSPPWVAIAVSYRWEAIGGLLFVLQSLGLFIIGALFYLGVRVVVYRLVFQAMFCATFAEYVGCGYVWSVALRLLFPLALGILFLASSRRPAREKSADFAPMPPDFPDFSPMPQKFEDFERMLEEAKQNSRTLICYECGHDNPVGESQCEDCGAWVPQTAKARWACVKGE